MDAHLKAMHETHEKVIPTMMAVVMNRLPYTFK